MVLNKVEAQEIAERISDISPYVRFAGIINNNGWLISHVRRADLTPLLNTKNTKNKFSHLATQRGMATQFNKQLGNVKFLWEEREKVQTISFTLGKNTVWVSIDKNVVRSEVLRIIDNCLPIVKHYQ
ncbi:hypothetical protein DYY67_0285 [Candidatus Nitrosotalea sp. TS]|uniref:hypothetical protein n=1 Tax=Candidatus Nitrosotalea sp. TS TaxID=2341020 RepID=UPI001ED188B7|nr:hypothetical protein [Candidatus Nitrosotalea sp. TS]